MVNSRESIAGAGWNSPHQDLAALMPPAMRGQPPLNWLRPKALLGARNDLLAKRFGDPSHEQRELWLREMYPSGDRDLNIDHSDRADWSFIVMGDTGEGDVSQYAVLKSLAHWGADTDFMVICSDVIYPAGEAAEYAYKFLWPYDSYDGPIYALPGNHDWYDDLAGFMAQFCGRTSVPERPHRSPLSRAGVRDRFWRKQHRSPTAEERAVFAERRRKPAQLASLPGPYYRIQTGPIDLVLIDTGIDGTIDAHQGAWLRDVSRSRRPKILLTGKPLYVDGERHPCDIDAGRAGTVDQIVRDPDNRYIASIGGDIHNYQRYPVNVDGRTIQYIVSGGGGAFMHATHKIPNIDTCDIPVAETEFKCFPLRGDSLAFYSQLMDKKLPGGWVISPGQASAYMAERLRIPSTKKNPEELTDETRKRANHVFPRKGRARGPWHMVFSEFFDWNDPPLFRHFLKLTVNRDSCTIVCHSALGCMDDLDRDPEDALTYHFSAETWSAT